MSVQNACLAKSLKDFDCILPKGHAGDHQRWDGKTWPEGQGWADVVDQWFRSQGIE